MTTPARAAATDPLEPRAWFTRYLRLQRRYDVQVNQRLRVALDDIERELAALEPTSISKVVKSAQLMQAMTAISAALGNFWMATGDIIRAGQEEARTEALKMAFNWDDVLLRLALPAAKRAAMRNADRPFRIETRQWRSLLAENLTSTLRRGGCLM